MYTPTNAYQRKFSSGLLLALLAFSGLLILVPFVSPASASNASLPTVTLSSNVVASGTTLSEALSISNPSSNSYALTALTMTAPSGWSFASGSASSQTYGCSATPASGSTHSSISCTLSLPPGTSATTSAFSILSATNPPATTTAPTGTFTTTVQDASSAAYYPGPTQKVYETGTSPTVAITFPTGDSCTSNTYTAGSSACKPLATLTTGDSLGYVGVPVAWSTSTYGSVTPASGFTGSAGTMSATFQPSNVVANGATTVTATLGTSTYSGAQSVTTTATTPVKATFYVSGTTFAPSATHYIGGANNAASSTIGGVGPNDATLAANTIAISATDKFSNPITLTGDTISVSTTSAQGVFYSAGNFTTITTPTDVTISGSVGTITIPYYQLGTYKSTDVLTGTITGTAPAFTVSGSSGAFVTSTFDTTSVAPTLSAADCGATTSCAAGSTVLLHDSLTTAQRGVPVTFYLDTTTSIQVNGDGTLSAATTTGANGTAMAHFNLDTGASATLYYQALVGDVAQTSGNLGNSTDSVAITTVPGAAAALVVTTYFDSALTQPTTKAINGSTLYVDVSLADRYGNPTTDTFNYQIQIQLSGPGKFSATNVYIKSASKDTAASFGPILWTAPNAFGPQALIATSSFPTVTHTVTLVSASPTLAVTSPTPLNGVIYSGTTAVTFTGQANVSLGYPTSTFITSVGYKIDSNAWQTATITANNKITWAVSVFLTAGIHTVQFNATDANSNTVVSPKYTVLVDTTAPNVNFVTVNNANLTSGSSVAANIVDSQGDLNASSVGVVATNIQTSATKTLTASVTGTNSPGHSVTYVVSISGLTTGNWSVALSATDLAGNSNSSTITVHVTVPFAQSFVISGTPHSATIGSFTGVNASYTNLNPTSQSVVVFAVFKNSAGQTMGIGTGSLTVGAGSTQSVFIADPVGLASGTYSVSIFVFTTGNLPVSVSTSISVTV